MHIPEYIKTRHLDLAIATSAYCQARCSGCIWPYMDSSNHLMSLEDFNALLDRFQLFSFGELALNIINEPFTDKTIIKKIAAIGQRKQSVEVLYFSSNWLIPNSGMLDDFVEAIQLCATSGYIEKIHLNATLSGIDENSYDIQQAGAGLVDAVMPYRKLDFEKAVNNVCEAISRLSKIRGAEKLKFRVKSYGDMYTLKEMQDFWAGKFLNYSIPENFLKTHVRIGQNESFTTFARSVLFSGNELPGHCKRYWLDKRLVVGARGEVGICCEDGLRSIVIGNLLEQDIDSLVGSEAYQEQLAITLGTHSMPDNHPCRRCSFFGEA